MLHPNFTPFPVLQTERLILRKLDMEDLPEVFFLRSDPTVGKFIKRDPAVNFGDAKNWILKILENEEKNVSINWAITFQEEKKLIGQICLWNIEVETHIAEVGYSLHPSYFGKGIMTEALLAINKYGFETLSLDRIDAYTNKKNERSVKMLEKNGYKRNLEFELSYHDKEELEYNAIFSLYRNSR